MKLFLLGGFLGSGKTTAIQKACLQLMEQQVVAAVITNDQGMQLVDSAFIKGHLIPGREVVKGCFCCNYSQLEAGLQSLRAEVSPEILFAESVGSCADIVATVINPLTRFHPDLEIVYSVFADARQLLQLIRKQRVFDTQVQYIYEKQLEEADLLVINKKELLSDAETAEVMRWLADKGTAVHQWLFQQSLSDEDIDRWLQRLQHFSLVEKRRALEIDYDTYGAGEARLAWLDEQLQIHRADGQAIDVAHQLINHLYAGVQKGGYPIGHLKFLMQAGDWQQKISFTSLQESPLRRTRTLLRLPEVSLLMNARIQTEPEVLDRLWATALQQTQAACACTLTGTGNRAFKPGFP